MYRIILTKFFKKQLKRLLKKDPGLKNNLINTLLNFNREAAVSVGHEIYKTRLCGQNTGKSGGYRVYVFIVEINKILTPIAIYSKSEKENLVSEEMSGHLEKVKAELSGLLHL